MKKTGLSTLLFLTTLSATAQSTYRQQADVLLQNLDKSALTTSVLYDRVFPAARLDHFTDSDTSSYGHFMQAILELHEASYSANDHLTPYDWKNLLEDQRQQRIITVGVCNQDINLLNQNAVDQDPNTGILTYNPDKALGINKTNALYTAHRVRFLALLSAGVPRGSVRLQLPNWAVLTNTSVSVEQIQVTLGPNQVPTILVRGAAPVLCYVAGTDEQVFIWTVFLSDGTQFTAKTQAQLTGNAPPYANGPLPSTKGSLDILPNKDGIGWLDSLRITASIPFQGYAEEDASPGQGDAVICYAQNRKQIKRPIIILDGFDPGDTRKAYGGLYLEKLNYQEAGIPLNLGIQLRRNELDNHDVILLNFPKYRYQSYTRTVYNPSTGQAYTIPIFDYRDGGADYVERNAFVLVKLIQMINDSLTANGSSERISIVGPSMGGLISRYALRYMELNGLDSRTKLWVSFDSPHHGANIPIGLQLLLDDLGNNLGTAGAVSGLADLSTPAARQMLLHHWTAWKNPPAGVDNELPAGSPGYRERFDQLMQTVGFPQSACLRKVSLVNGSRSGIAPNFPACGDAVRIRARFTTFGTVVGFVV